MVCSKCGCEEFKITERKTARDGSEKYRQRCKSCGASKSIKIPPKVKSESKKYVITSCQNDVGVNRNFFESIKLFTELNDCELIVLKTTSLTVDNITEPPIWGVSEDYLVEDSFDIGDSVRVLASIRVSNTMVNPLSGMDDLAMGKHIIVANNQLQMKTLFSESVEKPIFAYTTGTISHPKYTQTKTGFKAKRNHTYSFLYVEVRDEKTFIRDITSDESGCFYDITGYYSPSGYNPIDSISALVTGDEHAVKTDTHVSFVTYYAEDSIVNVLKPKYIVRHDVLDFYSGSHHHENDFILKYSKSLTSEDNVERELFETYRFIKQTTPSFSENIIVESNHNEHLRKWLNLFDHRKDPRNAKLYFGLMYTMMKNIEEGNHVSPFEAYCRMFRDDHSLEFTQRDKGKLISGVEVSYHGDRGANGTRGSIAQFAKTGKKYVIGHSHSPKIEKGCYQVGTSTSRLEYATGLTTWANTHCVIYLMELIREGFLTHLAK